MHNFHRDKQSSNFLMKSVKALKINLCTAIFGGGKPRALMNIHAAIINHNDFKILSNTSPRCIRSVTVAVIADLQVIDFVI